MAWGVDLSGLPRLASWEDCRQWQQAQLEKITSRHRNWSKEVIPLAGFSKKHIQMNMWTDNSFACVLYSTPLVIYFQGGPVIANIYDSTASRDFLSRMLPKGIRATLMNGWTYLEVDTIEGTAYVRPRGKGGITFHPLSDNLWGFTTSATKPRRIAKVNWRKFNRVAERIQPLIEWRKAALRLGLEPEQGDRVTLRADLVLKSLNDPQTWSDTFAKFPPEELPALVAEAEGVLDFDMCASPYLPPRKAPTGDQLKKISRLRHIQEVHPL